jgi:Xaa-Pro aminopeptidase
VDHLPRQKTFEKAIEAEKLDGFVITHPANLRYLCGYSGSNGLLLFVDGRRVFFTDGRYTQQAREEVHGARVGIAKGSLLEAASRIIGDRKRVAIGFEAEHTSVATANDMRRVVRRKVTWKPVSGLVMRQRMIKDAKELSIIRKAVRMGAEVYEQAVGKIRAGVAESEIAGELEFAARRAGADGMSFETIVAGGKRSALPHGRASRAPIPRRGFVVIDSGVVFQGYCSDMTRTVHIGQASREERRWYEAVLDAQQAGIGAVKPGVTAGDVDHAARGMLRRAKLDKYFTHSTGHGLGLEIHEPPRLGTGQKDQLQAGMVVTIEPGIYVPDQGGIRIEDMVVITAKGCEVLTPVSKELVEI